MRRIIQELVESGLLRTEKRFREDGSRTSNRYYLALNGGDKLSPASVTDDRTPGSRRPGPRDKHDKPRTINGSVTEPPQPPLTENTPIVSIKAEITDCGGGASCQIEYPRGLSKPERAEARKKLEKLPEDLAQQLLDELAGRMEIDTIRVAPLAYLRGLVDRVPTGTFTPEASLRIADKRKRQQQVKASQYRAETIHRRFLCGTAR